MEALGRRGRVRRRGDNDRVAGDSFEAGADKGVVCGNDE